MAIADLVESGIESMRPPVLEQAELRPVGGLEVRQGDSDEGDPAALDQRQRLAEERAGGVEDLL